MFSFTFDSIFWLSIFIMTKCDSLTANLPSPRDLRMAKCWQGLIDEKSGRRLYKKWLGQQHKGMEELRSVKECCGNSAVLNDKRSKRRWRHKCRRGLWEVFGALLEAMCKNSETRETEKLVGQCVYLILAIKSIYSQESHCKIKKLWGTDRGTDGAGPTSLNWRT